MSAREDFTGNARKRQVERRVHVLTAFWESEEFVRKKFARYAAPQGVQGPFDCVRLAPHFAQDDIREKGALATRD